MYSFSFLYPVSITYATPGMVKLVSAMLVDTMTRRVFFGLSAKILACAVAGRLAYNGSTCSFRQPDTTDHQVQPTVAWPSLRSFEAFRSKSQQFSISSEPVVSSASSCRDPRTRHEDQNVAVGVRAEVYLDHILRGGLDEIVHWFRDISRGDFVHSAFDQQGISPAVVSYEFLRIWIAANSRLEEV